MGRPEPTSGEVRWTQADLAIVDEVLDRKHRECPKCGHPPEDWGWYDADGKMHRHDPPRFEATTLRCFGCFEVAITGEEVPEDEGKGVYVVTVPTAAALGS